VIQNAAVFWFNYKSSGAMDSLALHAACPVLIGEKWGKYFVEMIALNSFNIVSLVDSTK